MRSRPVLVFDGDCGMCTRCAEFVEQQLPSDVEVVAFQLTDRAALGLTEEQCERALQWVAPSGQVEQGHRAVAALLIDCGLPWSVLGWITRTPPTSWAAALAYRWIAANRHRLPGGTPACALPQAQRSTAA